MGQKGNCALKNEQGVLVGVSGGRLLAYHFPEGELWEGIADLPTFAGLLEEELSAGRGVVLLGPEVEELLEEARVLARGGHAIGLKVLDLVPPGVTVAKDQRAMEVLEDLLVLRDLLEAGSKTGLALA
ncbi:hypothetical protein [Fervidobacterium sp.]